MDKKKTPDMAIKPAMIADDDLDEAQGGLRALQPTGIRATDVTKEANAFTIDARDTGDFVSEFQDGDDLFLRKRPGRLK